MLGLSPWCWYSPASATCRFWVLNISLIFNSMTLISDFCSWPASAGWWYREHAAEEGGDHHHGHPHRPHRPHHHRHDYHRHDEGCMQQKKGGLSSYLWGIRRAGLGRRSSPWKDKIIDNADDYLDLEIKG